MYIKALKHTQKEVRFAIVRSEKGRMKPFDGLNEVIIVCSAYSALFSEFSAFAMRLIKISMGEVTLNTLTDIESWLDKLISEVEEHE